ncbi:hypothetical protein, partial [Escherichia coli]|uniref:hypothetical protein n=1 Tax=Escherichia coli TaxID=562 RepID=UPI003B9E4596
AGVCYPPQKRVVQVTLPGSGAQAAAPASRAGAASPFNNPLAGAGNSGGLRLPGAASNSQALPLPSEQAFGFDAIAGLTHVLETLLDELRAGKRALEGHAVDAMLSSVDVLRALLREAEHGQA